MIEKHKDAIKYIEEAGFSIYSKNGLDLPFVKLIAGHTHSLYRYCVQQPIYIIGSNDIDKKIVYEFININNYYDVPKGDDWRFTSGNKEICKKPQNDYTLNKILKSFGIFSLDAPKKIRENSIIGWNKMITPSNIEKLERQNILLVAGREANNGILHKKWQSNRYILAEAIPSNKSRVGFYEKNTQYDWVIQGYIEKKEKERSDKKAVYYSSSEHVGHKQTGDFEHCIEWLIRANFDRASFTGHEKIKAYEDLRSAKNLDESIFL